MNQSFKRKIRFVCLLMLLTFFVKNYVMSQEADSSMVQKITYNSLSVGINGFIGIIPNRIFEVSSYDEGGESMFGGDAGIGLRCEKSFIENWNLSLEYYYIYNSFDSNIDINYPSFSRHIVSLAPVFVYPLRDINSLLKFETGADFYVFNYYSSNNGYDNIYKYKNGFGWHIASYIEGVVNKNWSLQIGLKYNAFNYKLNYYNDNIYKPEGTEFSAVLGVIYHL